MKTKILLVLFFLISFTQFSKAQNSYAILQDWADYIGFQDTIYKVPSTYDALENFITASFTVDGISGADIMVAVYDTNGMKKWNRTWSGSGNNRDQAVDVITDDSCNIFVTGFSYSTATNFDIVVLKYDSSGNLKFTYTLNGTANNYDIPAAIGVYHNFLYVTGEINDTVSLLNYVTIQLDKRTGALNWKREYDAANYFDVAFAMNIVGMGGWGGGSTQVGGILTIVGASQDTLNTWKYCTITYDSSGTELDTTRIHGTANSFDRPLAVKSDSLGNFYITGAATDSGASFNVRTAKIDTSGGLAWTTDFGSNMRDDEGNDLLVDDSGYVYVCGKTNSYLAQTQDYLLVKYSNSGVEQWYRTFDADTNADEAVKMCFDNYGNIVMTGAATRNNKKDILTIAYNRIGIQLWKTYFNGEFDGDDRGTDILSDVNGNIYVTGQMQNTDSTWQQVTIKYKTDYFTVPQDTVPAPSSMLFYVNSGQIIDTEDSIRTEGMYFYTINQFPKLYFHQDTVSFVTASVDTDTSIADTLERIAMNFEGGTLEKPYSQNVHDTDQVLNYFLGHCPDGITGITGAEQLLYGKVYDYIDVIFSNNNAGMKFQIIVNEDGDPNDITLHFTGHHLLSLISNSDLRVDGALGSFTYERPLVYQLDGLGNRISLGWVASYLIVDSANVKFMLGGDYNPLKPLVIECAREVQTNTTQSNGNLWWCMYYGGNIGDRCNDITTDDSGDMYGTGNTISGTFPSTTGAFQTALVLYTNDAFVTKFENVDVQKWSTFYGGNAADYGTSIAVDADNHEVYFTGYTSSTNFPLNNSFTHFLPNGSQLSGGLSDAFIVKLRSDGGGILWANYVGGTNPDWGTGIALNEDGDAYIVGYTASDQTMSFPCTSSVNSGSYNQSVHSNLSAAADPYTGYILRFSSAGIWKWGTYFGGYDGVRVTDVSILDGDFFITGNVTDPNNQNYLYNSTFCAAPTTGNDGFPKCNPGGGAHFQTNWGGGLYDNFIAEFNSDDNLIWSTFVGGSDDEGTIVHIDAAAITAGGVIIYLTGSTATSGTPFNIAPVGSYAQSNQGGTYGNDAYVMKFINRVLTWSTCFGGAGDDYSLNLTHDDNREYIIGYTTSTNGSTNPCGLPSAGEFPLCDYSTLNFFYEPTYQNFHAYTSNIFLAAFDHSTAGLQWSTYFAESSFDVPPYLFYGAGLAFAFPTQSLYLGSYSSSLDAIDFPIIWPGIPAWDQQANVGAQNAVYACFDIGTLIGIQENDLPNNLIHIFPNPAENYLMLSYKSHVNYRVNIINSMGEIVYSNEYGSRLSNELISIPLKDLAAGIYNLMLVENGKINTAKFVIQR